MDGDLFTTLDNQAKSICEQAWDEPELRYKIREDFYQKYGYGNSGTFGYGNSELAFIRWEINRGVLNPANDVKQPGSEWWKLVNWHFLYHGKLAELLYDKNITPQEISNHPSSLWLTYMYKPSPQTWYAAHNASITHGYYTAKDKALLETGAEQMFIRQVLMRLYFAHTMVMGEKYSLGIIGEFLANPDDNSVEYMVHIPDFYPIHYPLTTADTIKIMYKEFCLLDWLVKLFDNDIIGPHLPVIFNSVGGWIEFPYIVDFICEKKLTYPKSHNPLNFSIHE